MDTINVNDVFVQRWGYSCTIVDFYQVVHKTPKSVKVVRLKTRSIAGENQQSYFVKPMLNEPDPYYNRDGPKLYRVIFSDVFAPSIKIANYAKAYKVDNVMEHEFACTRD
jgi:hypothetical protein